MYIVTSTGKKITMEWIKCSDKLPPLETEVLVAVRSTIDIAERWEGYDGEVFWQGRETGLLYGITHWMPLPELPN